MSPTKGFSLIEVAIALLLLGLVAIIVVPRLPRQGYERKQFVIAVKRLLTRAWQHALLTHRTHRVLFKLDTGHVLVEQELGDHDEAGKPVYKELDDEFVPSSLVIPEAIQIKDFYIDGTDQMHRPGARVEEVWFFVYPDGTSQHVMINLFDTSDQKESEAGTRMGLVVHPFTARLSSYDTFQKP